MSINKRHTNTYRQELDLISKLGFKYLNGYRKAEFLLGESKAIELIHIYFSHEGGELAGMIDERELHKEFVEKVLELESQNPKLTVAESFTMTCGYLIKSL